SGSDTRASPLSSTATEVPAWQSKRRATPLSSAAGRVASAGESVDVPAGGGGVRSPQPAVPASRIAIAMAGSVCTRPPGGTLILRAGRSSAGDAASARLLRVLPAAAAVLAAAQVDGGQQRRRRGDAAQRHRDRAAQAQALEVGPERR